MKSVSHKMHHYQTKYCKLMKTTNLLADNKMRDDITALNNVKKLKTEISLKEENHISRPFVFHI